MDSKRRLVLTVSIGRRPWFELFRPYMELYARRWQADFRAVVSGGGDPPSPLACKETKIDSVYSTAADYDSVLYLDDTVFVRPDARLLDFPDDQLRSALFATVETHVLQWQELMEQAFAHYNVERPTEYVLFNSGVMLVSSEHREMFRRTSESPVRLVGTFVDQLWLNAMRYKLAIPLTDLGPAFNFVGSFLRNPGRAPVPLASAQFFHVTRAAGDQDQRLELARRLVARFG